MKRKFCFFLVIVLLTGLFAIGTVSAAVTFVAYPVEGGNIYYSKEHRAIVDCDKGVTSADIPANIEGDPVNIISSHAFSDARESLISVSFPNSVTQIDANAFSYFENLTKATFADGSTSIGNAIFYECRSLKSVTIPDSVTSIGHSTFYNCSSLENLTIPSAVTSIGSKAFNGCEKLKSITIPENITRIYDNTFAKCSSLTSVEIPKNVMSIGIFAFLRCSSLASVTIPESVTSIEHGAFSQCSSLTDVYYGGTQAQWLAITVAEKNEPLLDANIHFAEADANPFVDVKESDYFAAPVAWAVENGITNGVSATEFAPGASCTRGQIVTFLWRSHGCPEPSSNNNPFIDIKADAYYYKAVLWAVENGITSGMSETTFAPESTCTRAQAATFIWRTNGKPIAANQEHPFTDIFTGDYYYDAVLWAVENGITNGFSATEFAPNNNCTRAQIVTFLYRALVD